MTPNWENLASLAQEIAHASFSSLEQSLIPKDTLLRKYVSHCDDDSHSNSVFMVKT